MRSYGLHALVAAAVAVLTAGCAMLSAQSVQEAGSHNAPPASTNSGDVWQMQSSGTKAGLRGIDSVDGTVAWASGSGGTVLRTTDGEHWETCEPPHDISDWATLDFRGIQAWDSATAIVMASGPGKKSRLYKTVDACATWELLFDNPDSPNGFFDSFWLNTLYGQGMLLGDPVKGSFAVFTTDDGGKTWNRDRSREISTDGRVLDAFAASNSSIARSDATYLRGFVTGGKGGAVLFRRWGGSLLKHRLQMKPPRLVDSGWSQVDLPLAGGSEGAGAFSLGYRVAESPSTEFFLRGGGGGYMNIWRFVAVGGDYTQPNKAVGTAAWCSDGEHWTASTTPPHGYRSSVEWSGSLTAWIAAGTNGSDISRDDGRSWRPLDHGNWNALSLPFIVGPNGRIAKLNPTALSPDSSTH